MNQHRTVPAYRPENEGSNSSNVKKHQNAWEIFIPPSQALLDPLPSRPTADNPEQRVIGRVDRPALKLYLHILASSDSGNHSEDAIVQSSSSSNQQQKNYRGKALKKRSARRLGEKVVKVVKIPQRVSRLEPLDSFDDGNVESDGTEFNRILESGLDEEVRYGLVERRLTLADFRPLEAPFVPELIKMLVNATEADCHASDWEPIFATYQNLRETADMHACLLLQNWNRKNHLKRQITALSLPMKIAVLRSILSGFKQKPLHFSRRLLMDIIKRPLFDQFLRPNPNLKSIVKHTALPCNRTTMDTLAFLMLHLLHAWEYASNPLTAKLRLAKIYGPLLVSFAERPVVLDQDPSDYKTEEGAILEVVLEVCNSQFWDNLSMLQLRRAFTSKTRLERTRSKKGKLEFGEDDYTDRPESRLEEVEDSDYENEAWFSYLFPKPKTAAKEDAKTGEISISSTQPNSELNLYTDCRLLARLKIEEEKRKETEEETLDRYKEVLGRELHGTVLETTKPRIKYPNRLMNQGRFRNLYITRPLRSTQDILLEVSHSSRMLRYQRDPKYQGIPSRVRASLFVPSEPAKIKVNSLFG